MTFVGLLEADLQGASEYKTGGLGPLFQETRAEEPLALPEFLSRVIGALKHAGVASVVTLFIDDVEIYSNPDAGGEDNLSAVRDAAKDGAESSSFYLMLVHEDDELSHVITVEGAVDHPAEEAALTVLDSARFLDEGGAEDRDEDEDEDEADEGDAGAPDDSLPEITVDERDGEALVEAFLQQLLHELHKELALDQPELETWTDWSGEYDPELRYSSALPGGTGLGG